MYRIAAQQLKAHVGKLVQVRSGSHIYIGTLKGRGARILPSGSGRVDSTWVLQMRLNDVEFHPLDSEIYSMQYEPVATASWLR